MGLEIWLDVKRHLSGCDAVAGFGGGEAAVAVIAVAVGDVAGECECEGVPADVVGVCDDELCEHGEVALDRVEIARVGWCRDELDSVVGCEAADVWHRVGREVVLDPVDPLTRGVAVANLGHECEHVQAAAFGAQLDAQPVGVNVKRAEHVASAVPAVVVSALPLRSTSGCPAPPGVGRRLTGPIWSKLTTTPSGGGCSHSSRIRVVFCS